MDEVDGAREWDRWLRRVSILWKQRKKFVECGIYWNKENGKRRDVKGREMKEKFFTEYGIVFKQF